MGQVVTELVIDSTAASAGADQFTQSMDRANSSAQQGVGSVAGLTLAVAGVGIAFVGSLAALRGFVDYVGNTNKELIDLAANAANAGMTTKSFQETLFAAKSSGLTDKDFVAGLDKIGTDLTEASRGATDFGKLFEQNGISIKNANGELKTTEQAISDISNLIKNAPTPQVANAVASIVGLSKDWIPFLRQGVDEIEAQKKAAADLGVTIDDATIQKAKDFNNQWHTAIATWDLQFKASLSTILPLLVQMATLASTIIDGVGYASSSVSRWMTPDEDKTKQQLGAQAEDVTRLIDMMTKAGDAASEFQKLKINTLQGLLGLPEGGNIDQAIALLDKLQQLYEKPTRVIITGGTTGDGSTKLPPSGGGDSNALQTEIDRINKHIATTNADTEAVGETTAAQAGLRAEATLYAAAQRAGKTDLEQYADQFFALREKVEDATLALNKAKIASDIKFNQNTAFLSQGDVQIATQLKTIYPNVTDALNSAEAAQLRFNGATKELSTSIENSLVSGLTDIATGAKSAGQGFTDMGLAVVRAIEQMIIKLTIVEPLARSVQSALGGSSILSIFGGSSSLPLPGSANFIGPVVNQHGNMFSSGNVIPFATGGVVSGPTLAPMALMGEAGPEAIVPLKRGSDGNLGVVSSGGGGPTFVYSPTIDARGADSSAVAKLAQIVAEDKKNFAKNVLQIQQSYRANNPRAA